MTIMKTVGEVVTKILIQTTVTSKGINSKATARIGALVVDTRVVAVEVAVMEVTLVVVVLAPHLVKPVMDNNLTSTTRTRVQVSIIKAMETIQEVALDRVI